MRPRQGFSRSSSTLTEDIVLKLARSAAAMVALTVVIGACSGATSPSPSASAPPPPPAAASASAAPAVSAGPSASTSQVTTDTAAADLRIKLDLLLGEHIIFASKATGAALLGHAAEYQAYGAMLNTNGTDIGEMVGAAFGPAAKDQFNKIWSAHNGYFVDYTVGVASKDKAKQDKAVKDLTTDYVPNFSKFIADATGLPLDAVTSLITDHVLQTKQIVDDQAKRNWTAAYADIRAAYAHMSKIGDALAEAIVAKFPDKFPGDAKNKGVDFRVALDDLLQEHLYLATSATGAALSGMSAQFNAAGSALNTNGTDLGGAIGSLYGSDAQDQWNKIWSAHNGYFVDYTVGVATKDKAKQAKAVQDLTADYVPTFAKFLAAATGLPEDALTQLITQHVLTTKAVVDAQASGNAVAAAVADRVAGQHMEMIGDPLAKAIVATLQAKFQ